MEEEASGARSTGEIASQQQEALMEEPEPPMDAGEPVQFSYCNGQEFKQEAEAEDEEEEAEADLINEEELFKGEELDGLKGEAEEEEEEEEGEGEGEGEEKQELWLTS